MNWKKILNMSMSTPVVSNSSLINHLAKNEKLRFLIVGAYNTAFGYAAFVGLYFLLHDYWHYLAISLLSYVIAITNSFILQRKIVFRAQDALLPSFLRFNLSTAAALLFSMAGMALLVEAFSINPLLAQALVTCTTVVISFLLHRYYTFPSSRGIKTDVAE